MYSTSTRTLMEVPVPNNEDEASAKHMLGPCEEKNMCIGQKSRHCHGTLFDCYSKLLADWLLTDFRWTEDA